MWDAGDEPWRLPAGLGAGEGAGDAGDAQRDGPEVLLDGPGSLHGAGCPDPDHVRVDGVGGGGGGGGGRGGGKLTVQEESPGRFCCSLAEKEMRYPVQRPVLGSGAPALVPEVSHAHAAAPVACRAGVGGGRGDGITGPSGKASEASRREGVALLPDIFGPPCQGERAWRSDWEGGGGPALSIARARARSLSLSLSLCAWVRYRSRHVDIHVCMHVGMV